MKLKRVKKKVQIHVITRLLIAHPYSLKAHHLAPWNIDFLRGFLWPHRTRQLSHLPRYHHNPMLPCSLLYLSLIQKIVQVTNMNDATTAECYALNGNFVYTIFPMPPFPIHLRIFFLHVILAISCCHGCVMNGVRKDSDVWKVKLSATPYAET
jgi:hypothetical protein